MSLGPLGVALAASALTLRGFRGARAGVKLAALGALLALAFVPWAGVPLAGWLRGIVGELSVTTMILLAIAIAAYVGGPDRFDRRELAAVWWLVLVLGLLLYPMALGLTRFDPYALGYPGASSALVVTLAAAAAAAWVRRWNLLLAVVVLSVAFRRLQLLESQNLWDYLLDPWLFLSLPFWAPGFTIFDRFSKTR